MGLFVIECRVFSDGGGIGMVDDGSGGRLCSICENRCSHFAI